MKNSIRVQQSLYLCFETNNIDTVHALRKIKVSYLFRVQHFPLSNTFILKQTRLILLKNH